jgi:hypothetical protein
MPIDIIKPFLEFLEKSGKAPVANGLIHGSSKNEASLAL